MKISLKFVFEGSIDNIPALVQKMAWCQIGNKPLSEPMFNLIHWCIYAAPGRDELNYTADIKSGVHLCYKGLQKAIMAILLDYIYKIKSDLT